MNEKQKATQFKKGQSGNPGGRPKMPAHIREAQQLNQITFATLLNDFVSGPEQNIRNVMNDVNAPFINKLAAKALCVAYDQANISLYVLILDRLIGKVKESVEITGAKPTVIQLLNNEGTIVLGRENDEINSRSVEQLPEHVSGD